jgi:hypothetical protein
MKIKALNWLILFFQTFQKMNYHNQHHDSHQSKFYAQNLSDLSNGEALPPIFNQRMHFFIYVKFTLHMFRL